MLRAGAGPAIRYGCEIDAIGPSANDSTRTTVRYTQGGVQHTIDDIDLLVGTDGRYSATRATFSGLPEPRHVGVAIVRTLVPDTSGGLIDDYGQWFNGPHRLLAFRVPPDHVYIAATFPIEPGAPIDDAWNTEAVLRAAYRPAGGAFGAEAQWLMGALCGANLAQTHWARMQESDVLLAEPVRQVMYLGDSAHGMAPALGQGATQSMEGHACAAAMILAREIGAGRLFAARLARRSRPRAASASASRWRCRSPPPTPCWPALTRSRARAGRPSRAFSTTCRCCSATWPSAPRSSR